jgi:branched-chain amino acid aminotransferase
VVVTPVGKITYQGKTTEINQNQMGPIAIKIREMLVGIQREEIEDPFGWVLPVK